MKNAELLDQLSDLVSRLQEEDEYAQLHGDIARSEVISAKLLSAIELLSLFATAMNQDAQTAAFIVRVVELTLHAADSEIINVVGSARHNDERVIALSHLRACGSAPKSRK